MCHYVDDGVAVVVAIVVAIFVVVAVDASVAVVGATADVLVFIFAEIDEF